MRFGDHRFTMLTNPVIFFFFLSFYQIAYTSNKFVNPFPFNYVICLDYSLGVHQCKWKSSFKFSKYPLSVASHCCHSDGKTPFTNMLFHPYFCSFSLGEGTGDKDMNSACSTSNLVLLYVWYLSLIFSQKLRWPNRLSDFVQGGLWNAKHSMITALEWATFGPFLCCFMTKPFTKNH